MAEYVTTDTELTSIANAIRTKGGTSAQLEYPDEFVDAIDAIQTGSTINNQNKSVTPTESQQTVTADSGYTGLGTVTVGAIDSEYVGSNVTRRSSSDLTANGATVTAPAGYYGSAASKAVSTTTHADPSVSVNTTTGLITASHTQTAGYVSAGTTTKTSQLSTQAATTITPTESEQTAVAANKYTLGAVTVGAISSTYVGSGITQRDSTDLTASGATVSVPSGYYASSASKAVASGTAGTPTATKGAVSNHSVSVTPSVTNTTGYITGSTKTGTPVTVTASELDSGTKNITQNGTGIDVVGYATVNVAVSGGNVDLKGLVDGSITTLELPTDLTSIRSGAFNGCTSLELASTTLPSGITSIGGEAFHGCTALELTSLPSGLTSIGAYAFSGCRSITLTSLPSGITSIPSNAFEFCFDLALTSLPSGLTSIGSYAFDSCKNITISVIPSGVTSIQAGVFNGCTSIETITAAGTISSISQYNFNGSNNATDEMQLREAHFPNTSTNFTTTTYCFGNHYYPQYACHNLELIDLGSCKTIGANSFANCYKLQTVILRRSSVCSLGNVSAFVNTPMRGYNSLTGTVYVPSALISTYQTATNWSTLYNNGTVTFVAIEGSAYEL